MSRNTKSLLKGLLGAISISAALLTSAGAKELETHQVQISDLVSNSMSYIDQKVIVAGVLQLAPGGSGSVPRFVIVDNTGNAVPVTTWAPLEIPPFMPDTSAAVGGTPETMRDYVGRKLSVRGDYRITVDNTFQIVTESAASWVSSSATEMSTPSSSPVAPQGVVPVFKSGPPLSAKAKG